MKSINEYGIIKELSQTASNMYRMGWDERNGGNISVLLDESEVAEYIDINKVSRTIPMNFSAISLAGKYFLVTGTGKYFKNVEADPENNLGIIRVSANGTDADLLWGFSDGGKFTSELPTHLMSHMARLEVCPENRVILHSHPTYTISMNTVCPVDENDFTHRLWSLNTECIIVFPEGVGMLPWMVCGNSEIGVATAAKMHDYRIVIWTNHGIYGAGATLDEAFGLIETVEKTACIYINTAGLGQINIISDAQLKDLAKSFGLTYKTNILK